MSTKLKAIAEEVVVELEELEEPLDEPDEDAEELEETEVALEELERLVGPLVLLAEDPDPMAA
jgi:hypothetical protein